MHSHPRSHCLLRHKLQASRSSIHPDNSLTLPIWQVLSPVNFTTHVFFNANAAFLLHLLPPPTSTTSPARLQQPPSFHPALREHFPPGNHRDSFKTLPRLKRFNSATTLKINLTCLNQVIEALQNRALPTPYLISLHVLRRFYTLVIAQSWLHKHNTALHASVPLTMLFSLCEMLFYPFFNSKLDSSVKVQFKCHILPKAFPHQAK